MTREKALLIVKSILNSETGPLDSVQIERLAERIVEVFSCETERTEVDLEKSYAFQDQLKEDIVRYREALEAIRDYDSFQGGPIAPRATPTEDALRRIARESLRS